MIRAFVLYDGEPDPQRYAEHVELCLKVPADAFRHGRVFGAPMGDAKHRYYAEFEWPDMGAFKAAASSAEFGATAEDATAMGIPFSVELAEIA